MRYLKTRALGGAICILLTLPATGIAMSQEACERYRNSIATYEHLVQTTDDYIRNQNPKYGDMKEGNDILKSEIVKMKEEYREKCESPKPDNQGGPGTSQPGRKPVQDNPFTMPASASADPNNPFTMPPGTSSDPNNPFSMPGQPTPTQSEPVTEQPEKTAAGGQTGGRVEPPKDFDGKPCNFFTKGPTASRPMAMYPDGSYICFQDRMYECIDRYWKARADCGAYDKNYVKHAEEIEKSTINTKIYEEE